MSTTYARVAQLPNEKRGTEAPRFLASQNAPIYWKVTPVQQKLVAV
jgi:hypothetical protein